MTPINKCLYVDIKSYLVDNCLLKVDRMSMACSLETRVPYLDKELVELAFQIPDELKISDRAIKKQIAKLKEQDIIKRVGPDKGGFWEVKDKELNWRNENGRSTD